MPFPHGRRPRAHPSLPARVPVLARLSAPLAVIALVLLAIAGPRAQPAEPIEYELSFPEPHQRWMQVAVTMRDADAQVLEFRMSRSVTRPLLAARVREERVGGHGPRTPAGVPIPLEHPNPHQWNVRPPHGAVTLRYRAIRRPRRRHVPGRRLDARAHERPRDADVRAGPGRPSRARHAPAATRAQRGRRQRN